MAQAPSPQMESSRSSKRSLAYRLIRFSFILGILFLVTLSASALFAIRWLDRWSETEVLLSAPIEVELPRGGSLASLSRALEDRSLVSHWAAFYTWVRLHDRFRRFQAGLYRFEGSTSPVAIAEAMTTGAIYIPIVFQITVPEGHSLRQIAERLSAGGVGSEEEILSIARDPAFLKELKVPGETLEGFLYPATYPFSSLPSPREALSQMVRRFWKVLPAEYESRLKGVGLTLLQAVTFASLIELETARDDERSHVSEVIWNRLRKGYPLGIDAALIYGIKDYAGDIKWRHLRDESNPYNTRLRAGLPPSPIASPSINSLLAVLSPSKEGFMYYVVDPVNPGAHRFAHTLTEHNRNVREYVKAIRSKRDADEK